MPTLLTPLPGEGAGALVRNQMEGKRDPIVRDYHNQLDELVGAVLSMVRSCVRPCGALCRVCWYQPIQRAVPHVCL